MTQDYETDLPVYLRVRPRQAQTEDQPFLHCMSNTQVQTEPPKNNRYKTEETFSFNGVYRGTSTQLDVYKGTMHPLVENVLQNNKDSLFFTMGTSGAGKSHTTLGYKQTPGMLHMAIDTIFKSIGDNYADFEDVEQESDKNNHRHSSAVEAGIILDWSKTSKQKFSANSMYKNTVEMSDKCSYAVYISMVEVYNERIFNLLENSKRALIIKKDADTGKIYLADTQKIYVSEREEAYRVIDQGLAKRQANSTGMNTASSRSHAFISIEVKRISNGRRKEVSSAALTVVDLAGSERMKISKTAGKGLTESCAINKSLMLLGQCLQMQRDRERTKDHKDFSIFRSSKLTQLLLSNVFVPKLKQKTLLVVNVDPYGDYNSTSQMLRYSALAREIVLPQSRVSSLSQASSSGDSSATLADSRSVSASDDSDNVKHLVQRIQTLEQELAWSEERCQQIEQQVREEVTAEMEQTMEAMQSQYLDQMGDDMERSQKLVDDKVELSNTLRQREFDQMKVELEQLRQENRQLKLGK